MKKRGDSKKLFREGRPVLLQGKISIFFILLPLLNFFPQTVINNFGISHYIKTYSSYTKFNLIDFNNDGFDDLFLFGNQMKNFTIHKGGEDKGFTQPTNKFFFYPIDDFKWLTKSERGDDYYIFVSRNRRLAGLVSFTKSFSLQLLNTFSFNSYPSSIKITDLDKDGKNEALVFGNNFDGLILLKNDGYRLVADTLLKRSVFSDIEIMDFSQDEVDDLIVIDALYNSINFLENTEIGGFFGTRTIEQEETIYSSALYDLNNDSFADLILAKEKGIKIFYGDSVYSYSKTSASDLDFSPSEFLIGDFNKDGRNDLVSLNTGENYVEITLDLIDERNTNKFNLDGVSDLKLLSADGHEQIYLLSSKGQIQSLSDLFKWGEDFNLSIGGTQNKIAYRSSDNSDKNLFILNTEEENTIDIIRLNDRGYFHTLENITLINEFSNFVISADFNRIAGYTCGKRLIEIKERIDDDFKFRPSRFMYTKYPIASLHFNEDLNFGILEYNNDQLLHGVMEADDEEYETENPYMIDSLVIGSLESDAGIIYYWTAYKDTVFFKEFSDDKNNVILKIEKKDSLLPDIKMFKDNITGSRKILSIITFPAEQSLYLLDKNKLYELNYDNNNINPIISDTANVKFFGNFMGENLLLRYEPDLNNLKLFKVDTKSGVISLKNTIDGLNLNDYLIMNYQDHKYLVYTSNEFNTITFKVLE